MSGSERDSKDFVLLPVEKLHSKRELPFPVYLYMASNNKMLLYRPGGTILPRAKHEQMMEFPDRFFIRTGDMGLLEGFLRKSAEEAMSAGGTARAEAGDLDASRSDLQFKYADLLCRHLNFAIDPSNPLPLVVQAKTHIDNVINEILEILAIDSGILAKVRALLSSMDPGRWDHSLHVASLSALLAMSAGYTDRLTLRDIAVAGYLHDVGLAMCKVRPSKRMLDYTPTELAMYREHPMAGLDVIETLGLPVSDEVKLIVYQHEERHDGTGFPMGSKGADIFEPAQIVAIASRFDHLVRLDEPGWLTPEAALKRISEENGAGGAAFDPILLKQVFDTVLR